MTRKKRLTIDEAQNATIAAAVACDALQSVFDPLANAYPKVHPMTNCYRRALAAARELRQSLELAVESLVDDGAVCRDDCWWMVHPSLRPEEFKRQRRETEWDTSEK